ncbi:hypothetical protein [Plasticicumulans acidivorans]|uniref:Uncharacterized protein n=1 Tax=Plasticicumulans acidivorans TaxID=886464 RepID=A0A317MTZ2_9GAMM|nr:hypothetical protein [Plasticicumulans acidivorans]PWV61110.1 hypothetical protein C7443_106124 [Plasticicumulans acidivorans]
MTETEPAVVERLVYEWCTHEARGTHSARALAQIYASCYLSDTPLLNFADLKALDETRLNWALMLIRAYVEGDFTAPWPRAVALCALYDLMPAEAAA